MAKKSKQTIKMVRPQEKPYKVIHDWIAPGIPATINWYRPKINLNKQTIKGKKKI